MTYWELLEQLTGLDDEQLNLDATIYDIINDESNSIISLEISDPSKDNGDVLDEGHPYLVF